MVMNDLARDNLRMFQSISVGFCRFLATAPGKKKAVSLSNKNAKPVKQKLLKKQKMSSAKAGSGNAAQSSDRASRYSAALFKQPENSLLSAAQSNEDELAQRTIIAKAWSKWTMLQEHAASDANARFLRSKFNALRELQLVSPILYERAIQVDYSPAPLTIKPATETPPENPAIQ